MSIHPSSRNSEDGLSVVELLFGMGISGVVLAMLFGGLMVATRTEMRTEEDARVLENLRTASARVTKELRQSAQLREEAGASPESGGVSSIDFWVDYNRNGFCEPAEKIRWKVEPVGEGRAQLLRITDPEGDDPSSSLIAEHIVWDEEIQYFRWQEDAALVAVVLPADVRPDRDLGERVVRTEVQLRNLHLGDTCDAG